MSNSPFWQIVCTITTVFFTMGATYFGVVAWCDYIERDRWKRQYWHVFGLVALLSTILTVISGFIAAH